MTERRIEFTEAGIGDDTIVLRSHSIIKGRRRDMVSYSLLPDELAGGGGPAGRSTLKA